MHVFIRSLLVAGALPAIASADTALSPTPFVTLDQAAGDSAVQVQVTVPHVQLAGDPGYLVLASGTLRYVDPATHLGGYISMPVSYASHGGLDDDGQVTGSTEFGDVELGGTYALQSSVPSLAVIAHAGLELPTSNEYPRGTTLRFGLSPIVRSGVLFARADADFGVNLTNEVHTDVRPTMTLGAGAGIQLPTVAFTGELTRMRVFQRADQEVVLGEIYDVASAALSIRYTAGRIHPYAAVIVPLDHETRQVYNYELTGGVAIALR